MGKVKNAKRNPGMTWDDLRFAKSGDEIVHRGDLLTVVRSGRRGVMPWVLKNMSGAEISARVEDTGRVLAGATGRLIR